MKTLIYILPQPEPNPDNTNLILYINADIIKNDVITTKLCLW